MSAFGGISPNALTPTVQSAYNTKNQLVSSGYDPAGNQSSDNQGGAYFYDCENKMTRCTVDGMQSTYSYDGNGRRITKTVNGPTTFTTLFVYNSGGQLIAEYGGPLPENGGTSYLTTDHRGSTRVVTNSEEAVVARHDYLPFGEEIMLLAGGRTKPLGYTNTDDTRQKFTSKERDLESNLDFFEARYFSAPQGRFTGPDEFSRGARDVEDFAQGASNNPTLYADIGLPQSLNKYQYCLQNPLRYVDDDGHDYRIVEHKDSKGRGVRQFVWDAKYQYVKGDKNGAKSDYRYIDTQGRAIQLWGDSSKDSSKEADHGYSVVQAGESGDEQQSPQAGEAPKSFAGYSDTVKALLDAGYKQGHVDFHPAHWGYEDYFKPGSPTLHISVRGLQELVDTPDRDLGVRTTTYYRLDDATFHVDLHTQTGSWSELGKHVEEVVKKTVGIKP